MAGQINMPRHPSISLSSHIHTITPEYRQSIYYGNTRMAIWEQATEAAKTECRMFLKISVWWTPDIKCSKIACRELLKYFTQAPMHVIWQT